MKSKELQVLLSEIKECPYYDKRKTPCKRVKKFEPVINYFSPEQKYMVISSDPSGDTNKTLDESIPHSDFAVRFLSLLFSGSDSKENSSLTKDNYSQLSKVFDKYFYWTHFAKCYSKGNPNSFCAGEYLTEEIRLFHPKLLIILGNSTANFLEGNVPLSQRVGKVGNYEGIPTYHSLHPSHDWNLWRRPQYKFDETWKLIRSNLHFSQNDRSVIEAIFGSQIFP